jgi:hypothetical protein
VQRISLQSQTEELTAERNLFNYVSVQRFGEPHHLKHLGYAISRRIRLYGEEFEVVSDPFSEAGGIAVRVTTKKDLTIRVLQIPATVLQTAKGQRPH